VNLPPPSAKSAERPETHAWCGLQIILNRPRGVQNVTQLARRVLYDR
jgi:hypothetical protein